jgi:hypothetical protein
MVSKRMARMIKKVHADITGQKGEEDE